jgi:hypothetical protein
MIGYGDKLDPNKEYILILIMKAYSLMLGSSILFLILVSNWNFVTAATSNVVKPVNITAFTENSNTSHPHTPLVFSRDTSSYIHWKLSGR